MDWCHPQNKLVSVVQLQVLISVDVGDFWSLSAEFKDR